MLFYKWKIVDFFPSKNDQNTKDVGSKRLRNIWTMLKRKKKIEIFWLFEIPIWFTILSFVFWGGGGLDVYLYVYIVLLNYFHYDCLYFII